MIPFHQIPAKLKNNEITVSEAIEALLEQKENTRGAVSVVEHVGHRVIHALLMEAKELEVDTIAIKQISRTFCAMCSGASDGSALIALRNTIWHDMSRLHPLENYVAQIALPTPLGIATGLQNMAETIMNNEQLIEEVRERLTDELKELFIDIIEERHTIASIFKLPGEDDGKINEDPDTLN